MRFLTVLLSLMVLAAPLSRADDKEALALAETAIDLLGRGLTVKARETFFKALAHNENCPTALYELGKLFEAEGQNAKAADFLARAVTELGKGEKNNPSWAGKKMDAQRRLKVLNPYAAQFTYLLEEYSQDLAKLTKKYPDTLTIEEAAQRVEVLEMAEYLPKEKLPSLPKPAGKPSPSSGSPSEKTGTVSIAPDVERALKAAGWTTITGTWKKLADGKYEVTDGKLESAKTNGAVAVSVQAGGSGSIKILVRDGHTAKDMGFGSSSTTTSDRFCSGYGVWFKSGSAKLFIPSGGWTSGEEYYPYQDRVIPMPAAGKWTVLITVADTEKASRLEVNVNGKRESLTNYRIKRTGPMVVEISGTVVIENPKAGG